jgi:hypothetical protein
MRFIPTRIHGVLDYMSALLLMAAPWIFNFDTGGPEQWTAVGAGVVILLMSLCTRYELGAAKMVSMPTHLTMDFILGALLAASPWIFGFNDVVYMPHLVMGIFEMGAALMTHKVPSGMADRHHGTMHQRHGHMA